MKKIFLALMCFASVTVFASCGNSSNNSQTTDEQPAQEQAARAIDTKDVIEPLFLSEEEYTTQGYDINPNILDEMKNIYGIDGFGRLKGSDIQTAHSFTGQGEFSSVTDGFMFEFVLKDGATYRHDVFCSYAKHLYDLCKKAADDGKIYEGFWNGAKEVSFEQSISVVNKKQNNRSMASFYFINQGVPRKVEVIERSMKDDGFCEMQVRFERKE